MQTTAHGKTWLQRKARGLVGGNLSLIKVGEGTAAESETSTDLEDVAYASSEESEVNYYELNGGETTRYEIELSPGGNVAVGARITEMGIFVEGTDESGNDIDFGDLEQYTDVNGNLLFVRDTRSGVGLGDGLQPGEGTTMHMSVTY